MKCKYCQKEMVQGFPPIFPESQKRFIEESYYCDFCTELLEGNLYYKNVVAFFKQKPQEININVSFDEDKDWSRLDIMKALAWMD